MAFESLTDKLQNVFKKLRSKGRLTEEDGELYKVQVGAFLQLDNAIRMEQKLREDGYCTLIVTK